ncbi:MAG: zinc metallopeptidase [Schleiferiaceae bacterium]
MFIAIIVVFALVGWIVQSRLKNRFEKYSQTMLSSGMSGAEVARAMLEDYGIHDVTIESVAGKLTDHYNPANKTVNLSPDVYNGRNVAAAAVAAHECGHAVQHATAYRWLTLRTSMVPLAAASGRIMNILFLFMIFGGFALHWFPIDTVFLVVIAAQAALTAFSVVTLPVEYDASDRALKWLQKANITSGVEQEQATDALQWAARTYLVAAMASITTLLYYVMMFMGSRD